MQPAIHPRADASGTDHPAQRFQRLALIMPPSANHIFSYRLLWIGATAERQVGRRVPDHRVNGRQWSKRPQPSVERSGRRL